MGGREHNLCLFTQCYHKLVRDSISLFLCELFIAVCLSSELMEAASLRQKECNPPGIQWKQLFCIPGTSRGRSHLVGDGGVCWEMKWVLLKAHWAFAQIPHIHHWICGQSCPATAAMMVWYCQRHIHVPWQTLREVWGIFHLLASPVSNYLWYWHKLGSVSAKPSSALPYSHMTS